MSMKKVLNLILNQEGFVIVLVAILSVSYGIFKMAPNFIFIIGILLLIVFVMSQLVFRSLQNKRQ